MNLCFSWRFAEGTEGIFSFTNLHLYQNFFAGFYIATKYPLRVLKQILHRFSQSTLLKSYYISRHWRKLVFTLYRFEISSKCTIFPSDFITFSGVEINWDQWGVPQWHGNCVGFYKGLLRCFTLFIVL